MKKTDKKDNSAKRISAKRISLAQQSRETVQTAKGTRSLTLDKTRMHPDDPRRAPKTNALHTPVAQSHMHTLTARAIADHISQTVNGYDFKHDGYTAPAMQSVLDYIRETIGTKTGTIANIRGIMSRNDKAGDLSALAYWGLWSAKQYRNNPQDPRTDSMHVTITAQTANGSGINHIKTPNGIAKITAMHLR